MLPIDFGSTVGGSRSLVSDDSIFRKERIGEKIPLVFNTRRSQSNHKSDGSAWNVSTTLAGRRERSISIRLS